MGREISLFADYHQKENSVTNYCGLLLKLLYQEDPIVFEEVLTSLVGVTDIKVGPSFTQQEKKPMSVPDMAIMQRGFSIFVETKIGDWFYSEQIQKHMKGLAPGGGVKILLLLSNFEEEDYELRFKQEINIAQDNGIVFQPITFENLVDNIKNATVSERFQAVLSEFEVYLDANGYLPKWKWLLDVVNCGKSLPEIEQGVYMCPDRGASYCHRRAKYFGPYADKCVKSIFQIDALVSIAEGLSEPKVKWNNIKTDKEKLIQRAISAIKNCEGRIQENQNTPLQVFLLSQRASTNFLKSSPYGMQATKKYFWNIAVGCNTSEDLAKKLNGQTWEIYRDICR